MLHGANPAETSAIVAFATAAVTLFCIVTCGRHPCRSCAVNRSAHPRANPARTRTKASDSSANATPRPNDCTRATRTENASTAAAALHAATIASTSSPGR